jgi:L-ascorbate metabolism protein UlaG (beta-lactamase superfamily)
MKIIKYAQSCVLVQIDNKNILIDPGNYGLDLENLKDVDIILITHKHEDHCSIEAIKTILDNSNPLIITNKEVNELLKNNGIDSNILDVGKSKQINEINIKAIKGKHGLPPNNIIPEDIGFLINDKIYHPGDTVNFEGKPYADLVLVPIVGPELNIDTAVQFVNEIKCKIAIPIHYDSPRFPANPEDFLNKMKNSNIEVKILKFGESFLYKG